MAICWPCATPADDQGSSPFPRRQAGARLDRLGSPLMIALAWDAYRSAQSDAYRSAQSDAYRSAQSVVSVLPGT
jgi:hypothetical protein